MSYHSVLPNSQRAQYEPSETVDWTLNFPGFSMLPNTLRISGNLVVRHNNAAVATTDDILMDSKAGIDAVADSFVVSMNDSVKENIQSYPRMVKMRVEGKQTPQRTVSEAVDVTALRTVNDATTKVLFAENPVSFSFKPNICLNNSTASIPYAKSGEIKVSMRLANANQVLYGSSVDNTTTYHLTDLRCEYRLTPTESGKQGPILMSVKQLVKQNVGSTNVNLSINVPIPTNSVSASFIEATHQNTNSNNHLATEKPPNVTRVEYSFNDQTNLLQCFALENEMEILYNYLRSLSSQRHNDITLKKVMDEDIGYGIGINYLEFLANQKLAVNIQSGVSNNVPYSIYLYFQGMMKL